MAADVGLNHYSMNMSHVQANTPRNTIEGVSLTLLTKPVPQMQQFNTRNFSQRGLPRGKKVEIRVKQPQG